MERNLRKIPLDMSEQGRFRRERFPGRKFSRLNNYPMDNSDEDNYGKHPPHLKGKEIGLFYAMRNKNRQKSKNRHPQGTIGNRRPLGTIYVSENHRQHIQDLLLECLKQDALKSMHKPKDGIPDSKFKRDFLKHINGNIYEKLSNSTPMKQDEKSDMALYLELESKELNVTYQLMQRARQKLPSYDKRDEIMELLKNNQVVLISGETGCGKTTQVAQFILDDYIKQKKGSVCRIVCTQPRRISAIAVAGRVAEERAEPLGNSVGYHIRLERKFPRDKGSICFCTTGVLLKQMENDPCLSSYSHLILDEIHERDIMSDFLITLIRDVIQHRKDLKIILMSATLNAEKFAAYFNNCAQINIPGFTFPVEEFYLEDVIEKTGYVFPEDRNVRRIPNRIRGKKRRQVEQEQDAFSGFIEPYVRELERGNVCSRNTCIQLRNPNSEKLDLDLIMALLVYICRTDTATDKGAILVFLTGYLEISNLYKLMEQSSKFPPSRYRIIPLHSQMPTVNQKQIFERPPQGIRKIVLSTNIAETSITIDDVVFVIDCGRIKMNNFNVEMNSQMLVSEWVSLANASQRKGRAGRVQAGVCYHLFTRARKMLLEDYQKPEILRTRLECVILTAKVLQLADVQEFFGRLMDPPSGETVKISLDLLRTLNALDSDGCLTPLGYHMAKLPLGPQMGKMILLGALFSCLDPVLSVAATLDFKDPFQLPMGREAQANFKKLELAQGIKSDHLLYHIVLREYETNKNNRGKFCWDHFLSPSILSLLSEMKKQFMRYLYDMNFVPNMDPMCKECNRNSENVSLVKAIICAGLYPNILTAKMKKNNRMLIRTLERTKVEMHPKSILSKAQVFESPLLVYYLKMRSTADFVHDATMVHPLPLIFFGEDFSYQQPRRGQKVIVLSDRVRFKCSENTAEMIRDLRTRLNWFLEYKISHPGFVDWSTPNPELNVLSAIMELITIEDIGDLDLDAYDDYDSD